MAATDEPRALTPVQRVVALTVVVAVALQGLTGWWLWDVAPVAMLVLGAGESVPHGASLVAALLALTVAADLVAVRVRHGEETEELTLLEAAVVVCALLLPPAAALGVPVAASLLTALVRRRAPLKAVFNAANLAASTAVLVAVLHLVAVPGEGLSARTVAGLLLGTLGFTLVNLAALSVVIATATGGARWEVARDGARLSVVMAIGTVALGGSVVTVTWASPALLPFTLMPAAALTFAYRATQQEHEERERSGSLLRLSHVLAGGGHPDTFLPAVLAETLAALDVEVAEVLLDADPAHGVPARALTADGTWSAQDHARLAVRRTTLEGAPVHLTHGLPDGWAQALVCPLESDGTPLGALVVATRDRRRTLGAGTLTTLTPLASAVSAALSGAAYLAQVDDERSKLRAVVDGSSDGILVVGGDHRVQLWSPAVARITGLPEEAALGQPLDHALVSPDLSNGVEQLRPDRPHVVVELTVIRPDGEQRVVRCAHAATFDRDELVRDVVVVHDVTREREVEQLKADFVARVSHELRTPITPIKGYADLLRKHGDRLDATRREECLAAISERAGHLSRLVEDLLLASRLAVGGPQPGRAHAPQERPTPTLAEVDLGALARSVAAGGDASPVGPVVVQVPPDGVRALGDPERVRQVLSHLLSNARKFSDPGATVHVVVRREVTDHGPRALVTVTDAGRGIPQDQLERVFEPFHRVEDPLRMTTGGAGLGLTLARELAHLMGGRLTLTSTLGDGTSVTLELGLPVPPSPAGSPPVVPAPRRAASDDPTSAARGT